MNKVVDTLDSLPLATLVFVLGALGGVYCLIQGSIDYEHFLIGLSGLGVGSAAMGHVRTQAGKGLAPKKRVTDRSGH